MREKRALSHNGSSQVALVVENLSENAGGTRNIWNIPWTKEPGGLQSMGSQKGKVTMHTPTTHTSHSEWFFILLFFFPYLTKFSWVQTFRYHIYQQKDFENAEDRQPALPIYTYTISLDHTINNTGLTSKHPVSSLSVLSLWLQESYFTSLIFLCHLWLANTGWKEKLNQASDAAVLLKF